MLMAMIAAATSFTSFAEAQAPETPTPRVATLRSVHLRQGESLAIALHPAPDPIEVRAAPGADLEVCPAGNHGEPPEADDSSWPRWFGFLSCIPLDPNGSARLPSALGGLFHLAFLVRAPASAAVTIHRLTISYAPVDAYFEVLPPPIPPGTQAPLVSITPTASRTIGTQAYASVLGDEPLVRSLVRQGGRRLGTTTARPPGGEARAYGPVRLDQPVRIETTNRGAVSVTVRIQITWE